MALENMRTAALLAQYALAPGLAFKPEAEATLIIEPPAPFLIALTPYFVPRNTPSRFTDITRCHSERVISVTGFAKDMPALLTSMSSLFLFSRTLSIARSQSVSEVTSSE